MDYDETRHTDSEIWSLIYRTLKDIREVRELLCTDELEKIFCMGHRTKRFFQWSGKMGERF